MWHRGAPLYGNGLESVAHSVTEIQCFAWAALRGVGFHDAHFQLYAVAQQPQHGVGAYVGHVTAQHFR